MHQQVSSIGEQKPNGEVRGSIPTVRRRDIPKKQPATGCVHLAGAIVEPPRANGVLRPRKGRRQLYEEEEQEFVNATDIEPMKTDAGSANSPTQTDKN